MAPTASLFSRSRVSVLADPQPVTEPVPAMHMSKPNSDAPGEQSLELEPAFPAFAEIFAAGRPALVWTRLIADLETPVSAMLKLARVVR